MPRRKQPPSLKSSSLRVLAKLTVDSCVKSDGKREEEIRQYVQDIQNTFANEYVNEVLQLHSKGKICFDIASALHPKCTVISKKGAGNYFSELHRVLGGVNVMRDLINIEPEIALRNSLSGQWGDFEGDLPFPKMTNLRSIEVSFGTEPLFLAQAIENCPQLESIVINNYSLDKAMQPALRLLSNCKHLKRICGPHMTPEVAIHLLDHLPNLEVLEMKCILEVLPLCKSAYKLKDFVAPVYTFEVTTLQNVVTHFPYLEKLSVNLVEICIHVDLKVINELDNLKSLTLDDRRIIHNKTSSNLLFLMDKCMLGLHELHLEDVIGLDSSLFRQNMNVSYPNLTSLTMWKCTGINLAAIMEIFPKLKSLDLVECKYIAHSLPCKMTHAGFQELEHLEMTNVPIQQVKDLIPYCSKLKILKVFDRSDQSYVYELLSNANLKELLTLEVHVKCIERDIIQIILDSCGEYLENVILRGHKLTLSPEHVQELSNQLQQYDMHFSLSGSRNDPHFVFNSI